MRQTPKPNLNPLFTLLLALAYVIAPKVNHEWLEDMQFELGFITGFNTKGRFLVAALRLACQWRLEALAKLNLPQLITLASASVAALFILIVFLPQTNAPQKAISLKPSPEVRTEVQPAEADSVSAQAATQVLGETSRTGEIAASPAMPETPSSLAAPAPSPTITAGNNLSSEERETDALADDDSDLPLAKENNSFDLSFPKDTVLILKALSSTELTVMRAETPLFKGNLAADTSFSFEPPALLSANDFSKLELYENDQKLDLPEGITRLELLTTEP